MGGILCLREVQQTNNEDRDNDLVGHSLQLRKDWN